MGDSLRESVVGGAISGNKLSILYPCYCGGWRVSGYTD